MPQRVKTGLLEKLLNLGIPLLFSISSGCVSPQISTRKVQTEKKENSADLFEDLVSSYDSFVEFPSEKNLNNHMKKILAFSEVFPYNDGLALFSESASYFKPEFRKNLIQKIELKSLLEANPEKSAGIFYNLAVLSGISAIPSKTSGDSISVLAALDKYEKTNRTKLPESTFSGNRELLHQAENYFQKSIKLSNEKKIFYKRELGKFYEKIGKLNDAEKIYLECLENTEDFLKQREFLRLGHLTMAMGKFESSKEWFGKVIGDKFDRNDIFEFSAYFGLGNIAFSEKNFSLAEKIAEEICDWKSKTKKSESGDSCSQKSNGIVPQELVYAKESLKFINSLINLKPEIAKQYLNLTTEFGTLKRNNLTEKVYNLYDTVNGIKSINSAYQLP